MSYKSDVKRKRKKAPDTSQNGNIAEGMEIISAKHKKKKTVALRVDSRTIILVPKSRATNETINEFKEKLEKSREAYR